jgi:hypothetical protein
MKNAKHDSAPPGVGGLPAFNHRGTTILVDLTALSSIAHACDPLLCRSCGSCCGRYEIALSARELERMVGISPEARKFQPDLDPEDFFEELDDGGCALASDEDGLCAFAWRDQEGRVLCSAHSAALARGLDPYRVKPSCCSLWPLALSEGRPRVLTVQDDAFELPCNRRRRDEGLDSGVADIIRGLFGARFLSEVREALAESSRGKRRAT